MTSIARRRASGAVYLSSDGFAQDKVAQPYHGGPDAAACVHLAEHYAFWREKHATELPHGHLGENLVLEGIEEAEICAGDVVRIGAALVQVSCPRIPCDTQARRAGRTDWVKLTIRENRTGFYLRVRESGEVEAGDRWLLQERPHERASIPALNRCLYLEFDPALAAEFAQMDGLADWWKGQFLEKLARTQEHWSDAILQ
ncbi:MAG TPA: MOSC domain-containing protein [Terracidiphilus sp.]|nr:MOSC domain-containing protein [Terracidiphilus sp.]